MANLARTYCHGEVPKGCFQMRFEWDKEKNNANIRQHGLDFADAWEIFMSPMITGLDDRFEYGEDRWIAIGMLQTNVVVVVFVERGEDTIRLISLRKALSYERKQYEQALQDGLGPC